MEQVILTQISLEEFRAILREEIGYALRNLGNGVDAQPLDEILDIDAVCQFLHISKGTIYKKTAKREIPHCKVGKRLYFKRSELIEWISKGRQKTRWDIEDEAIAYLSRNRK